MIPSSIWEKPDSIFSTDSCLTGCRALSSTNFMHFIIPDFIIRKGRYVNQFEIYAILIAVCEWAQCFTNLNVLLYCDNWTIVTALQSGRINCTFMQDCLREIRFHLAKYNFRIRAVYLSSSDIRLADDLSRWHIRPKYKIDFLENTKHLSLSETVISNFEIFSC